MLKTLPAILILMASFPVKASEDSHLEALESLRALHQKLRVGWRDSPAVKLINRYNAGFRDQDVEAILSCIAPTFFKFTLDETLAPPGLKVDHHPRTWRPSLFLAGDSDLRDRLTTYVKFSAPYENHVTFRKFGSGTSLQSIVTEETGRRGPVTWVKRKSTWIVVKIKGEWKILGLFVNCPNVPDEVAWSDWRIH